MKILIGTPIHISKDYCMERWLENVAKLQQQTPADLFLVDNSPGLDPVRSKTPLKEGSSADHAFQAGRTSNGMDYVEKVKGYCAKYGIKNYKIEHIEINQKLGVNIRVEASQEMIRRHALSHDYDAWFSLECDQIIPTNAIDKLAGLMKSGNYLMVVHNSWARTNPADFNTNMGCTLISREALKKGWFLPDKDGQISFDLSDCHNVDETMFKKRVLKNGGNYIEVFGIINPIYHLDN